VRVVVCTCVRSRRCREPPFPAAPGRPQRPARTTRRSWAHGAWPAYGGGRGGGEGVGGGGRVRRTRHATLGKFQGVMPFRAAAPRRRPSRPAIECSPAAAESCPTVLPGEPQCTHLHEPETGIRPASCSSARASSLSVGSCPSAGAAPGPALCSERTPSPLLSIASSWAAGCTTEETRAATKARAPKIRFATPQTRRGPYRPRIYR
jgi:hypothetical protein